MGKQCVSEPEFSEFAFLLGTLELPQRREFQQGFLRRDWPAPALVCRSRFAPFLHGFPELLPTGHRVSPGVTLQGCSSTSLCSLRSGQRAVRRKVDTSSGNAPDLREETQTRRTPLPYCECAFLVSRVFIQRAP